MKEAGKLKEYRLPITNKFLALRELHEEKTIDEQWKKVRDAISSTFKEVLEYRKTTYKKWISLKTLDKIVVKKQKKAGLNTCHTGAEKNNAQEAYFHANRSEKKGIKADKKNFVNQLATEAEEAA